MSLMGSSLGTSVDSMDVTNTTTTISAPAGQTFWLFAGGRDCPPIFHDRNSEIKWQWDLGRRQLSLISISCNHSLNRPSLDTKRTLRGRDSLSVSPQSHE